VNRIADLTWTRPKLVLAAVGVFFLIAVAFGHDVEHHLKAAGFTDPSSESEQGSDLLSNALGYDPNPGVVLVVRAPGGGPLNLKSAPLRRQVDQLSGKVAKVKYIGRVVNPLQDPRAGAQLIARDGRSLVILGDLANTVSLGGYSGAPDHTTNAVQGITDAVKVANPDATITFDAAGTSSTSSSPIVRSAGWCRCSACPWWQQRSPTSRGSQRRGCSARVSRRSSGCCCRPASCCSRANPRSCSCFGLRSRCSVRPDRSAMS